METTKAKSISIRLKAISVLDIISDLNFLCAHHKSIYTLFDLPHPPPSSTLGEGVEQIDVLPIKSMPPGEGFRER
jgi:hypothetical protein